MGKISQSLDSSKVKQCAYRKIFLGLDEEDMIAINDAVSRGMSGYVIANALRDGGYSVAHSTVSMHLNKKCKCV